MNYTRNILLIFLLFSTYFCGPKKKVEKFEPSKKLFFAKNAIKIPAFKKLQTQTSELEILESDNIDVTAQIIVMEKNKPEEYYYEVNCPSRAKNICGTGSVYIKPMGNMPILTEPEISKSLEISKSANFAAILIESSDQEKYKKLREWLTSPSKQTSVEIDSERIMYLLSAYDNSEILFQTVKELSYVLQVYDLKEYTDKTRMEPLVKKYAVVNPSKPGVILGEKAELINKLKTLEEELEKKYLAGFPMRSQTYKGLVEQFNKSKKIPYMQEKVFTRMIKESVYKEGDIFYTFTSEKAKVLNDLKKISPDNVSGVGVAYLANWVVEISPFQHVKIISEIMDSEGNTVTQEELLVESITAYSEKDDVSFKIKTDQREYKLASVQIGDYLLSGGPGLKEYIKQFPAGKYTEIIANNSYYKALVMTALKEGKGGFNEETGEMQYTLNSGESYKYWVMLEIFRMHPNIKRKSDYSGTTQPGPFCYDPGEWRQPTGELYIGCIRENCTETSCKKSLEEMVCMKAADKGGSETLQIRFSPADIRSENPAIKMTFTGNNECDPVMNYLLN